jgi:hypothetical protein
MISKACRRSELALQEVQKQHEARLAMQSVREMEIQQKLYTDYMQEIKQRDEEHERQLQRERVKLRVSCISNEGLLDM